MQHATDAPTSRPGDLRRNLLLVASYLAILTLIAVGYQ
jgi:hypothetical protein